MSEKIIRQGNGTIVDVRSRAEYQSGHAAGSVNIPVNEILQRLNEIKALPEPVILCCASGNRSGMAAAMLRQHGVDCHNAGSWLTVNYWQSQTVQNA
jgi:phage shock protein E